MYIAHKLLSYLKKFEISKKNKDSIRVRLAGENVLLGVELPADLVRERTASQKKKKK